MKVRTARVFLLSVMVLAGAAILGAQTPVISTAAVPNGEVNLAYPLNLKGAGFTFTATGGSNYRWSEVLSAGKSNLPPGLTLSGSGVLGGAGQVPTTAGTYTFTVQVSCDSCSSAQHAFTMNVFPPLQITSPATIPGATTGIAYQYTFAGLGGNVQKYSWTLSGYAPFQGLICSTGTLPPGMCLNPTTGALSGTPTKAGTYALALELDDLDIVNFVDKTVSITVAAGVGYTGLVASGPLDLGAIALGGSISGAVTASGGTPPYTFTATGAPAGVTFSSSGGIAGKPAAPGSYTVGVTVTDAQNGTAATTITFSVFGIVTGSLPSAIASSLYSFFVTATGGKPPYTFAGSGLPPQFSLSTEGLLTGTASDAGTYTIAVTAKDANGLSNSASFPFSVDLPGPLKVPGGSLSDTTVLTPYSQTLSATGGAPPYTWTLAGGSFPDGLTLGSTGTVSGTPVKTGSWTFSARAADATGASIVGTFSLNVAALPVTITTPSPLSAGMATTDYPVQTLSASGGIEPYTFAVTASTLPAGLTLSVDGAISGTPASAGGSSFTVTATDSTGHTGTKTFQITVRPFSADLILSTGSVSFSVAAGSSGLPGGQTVQAQSSDVTKTLSYSTAVTPAATWLSVTKGGTAPGSFSVALTSAALSLAAAATPYQTTIAVACVAPSPCAGSSQTVAVSLAVTTVAPQLTVVSDVLSFATSSTPPQATSQDVVVRNTGGGSLAFTSVTCPPVWCKVGSLPAPLGGGATGAITITADPTGLDPGFYYTTLTIVSSVGTTSLPITYFITANSSLALNPAGVQLTMPAGGVAAVSDPTFLVSVSGTVAVPWTATLLPGAPWLKLAASSGTSTGAQPGSVGFSIDQTAAAGLTAGVYYGTIRIASSGAANSPQDFQVVLSVTAATDNKQKPNPSPAGLVFITSGAAAPAPQTLQIFASSVPAVNYQASATTESGNPWLSVNPVNGVSSASAPGHATVTVSPGSLTAGVYHGTVSYSFSASAVRTVNVTLIVQKAVQSQAVERLSTPDAVLPHATSCIPTQLFPTQTGLVSNFAAPASFPTPLEIQLVNDCGTPVTNGQISATFSNGDPPLGMSLADPSLGTYSGTWTPRRSGPQVTITGTASAPGLPAATVQISGSVVPNIAPVLNHNGTLHIFTPQLGGPLAPGTIVQIYGSSLATQTLANTTIPLATSLAGTTVIIGGLQAPLYFVSPGQINAQLPFELAPGQPYQVIVSNNGALTTPDGIQSSPVTPGVAALASGAANAQHVADSSGITEASPAKPGEFVVLYLAGMGLTTVPVPTGAGAPGNPLAQTQSAPSVTLNSEPVTLLFSGLTPGLAGLYQIDLQVPADAPDGDLTLVVNQPGFQGSSVILPVHH